MKDIIIPVAGSFSIKFEAGRHGTGRAMGCGFRESNEIAKDHFYGKDGFTSGGVIDRKDMKRLGKWLLEAAEEM